MEDGGAAAAPLSFEAFIRRIQEDPARDLVRTINMCARARRAAPPHVARAPPPLGPRRRSAAAGHPPRLLSSGRR
jgi:hypothetical protein